MAAQPQVQEQMAQMAAVMQNTALMERMEQLKVRGADRGPSTAHSFRRETVQKCTLCMTAELAGRTNPRRCAPSSPSPLWYAQGDEMLARIEEMQVGCTCRVLAACLQLPDTEAQLQANL